ncbi:MAG: arsenate reductase/protein-tyrosine-phosphatase family protein [Acidimicrobiales bacterium]
MPPTAPEAAAPPRLLVVCTGNAARSVMAGSMLGHLAVERGRPLEVVTAGTHAVEGQVMSLRTRAALAAFPELAGAPVGSHRSRQLVAADLDRATLVVAMEADHVRFVRRHHPEAAGRTATLRRLVADLAPGRSPLAERVAALALADVAVDPSEDVADPAGHEEDVYVACARELFGLCAELVERL